MLDGAWMHSPTRGPGDPAARVRRGRRCSASTGGALGCWIVLYELSYSAESLAHALFPGLVVAALAGRPAAARRRGRGSSVAALAIALAGRAPEIGRDTAVAVVVTALFGLGALLALSPDSPPGIAGAAVRRRARRHRRRPRARRGPRRDRRSARSSCCTRGSCAVGFDRSSARRSARRAAIDIGLLPPPRARFLVAVQGLGDLLVVAVLIAPAAAARLVAGGWRR